jgi:hypothetical protein
MEATVGAATAKTNTTEPSPALEPSGQSRGARRCSRGRVRAAATHDGRTLDCGVSPVSPTARAACLRHHGR